MPGGMTSFAPVMAPQTIKSRTSNDSGSTWSNWTSSTFNYPKDHGGYKTTNGVNTPGYGRRSVKLLPHTLFSQYEVHTIQKVGTRSHMDRVSPPGNTRLGQYVVENYINPQGGTNVTAPQALALSDLSGYMQLDEAYACVKDAAADIYDETHDGLTFMAEFGKTAQMMNGIHRKFSKVIARKGRLTNQEKKDLLDLPGHWLQARYGLRPLLSDIEQLSAQLAVLGRVTRQVSKASKSRSYSVAVDTVNVFNEDANFTFTRSIETTVTCSARGSVSALITKRGTHFNPVVTAWELVPYSFVADWFVDVGSTLKSLSLAVLADEVTASTGFHVTCERDFTFNMAVKPSYNKYLSYMNTGGATCTMEASYRSPIRLGALYVPQPRLKFDISKLADLGALAWSLIRRR